MIFSIKLHIWTCAHLVQSSSAKPCALISGPLGLGGITKCDVHNSGGELRPPIGCRTLEQGRKHGTTAVREGEEGRKKNPSSSREQKIQKRNRKSEFHPPKKGKYENTKIRKHIIINILSSGIMLKIIL